MKRASRNQLGNANNVYQGDAKRVLCVCSAGLLRSPTLANVLHLQMGYNTRAAGVTEEYALVPVSHALLQWAHEVVCMDASQKIMLEDWMSELQVPAKPVFNLNVPDMWNYGHKDLRKALLDAYKDAME